MFASDIALDGATGTESTFKLISQSAGESTRIDSSTTLAEPKLMTVKHTVTGKGAAAVDRHLLQFSLTKNDAAGLPKVCVVNFTVAVPRSTITTAEVKDLAAYAVDFISDGGFSGSGFAGTTNIGGLLIGEN